MGQSLLVFSFLSLSFAKRAPPSLPGVASGDHPKGKPSKTIMKKILLKFRQIPRTVYILGFVSLFNDIASEMLYPVMPIFLTDVLHAPVYVVGIIEGVAEGTSALFKTWFGYLSDKLQRRKPFVVAGYASSAIAKIIIALAQTWPFVFLGRFVDRFGKGLRTGARDALLLEQTDETNKGLIFGLHRSMDSAGAVLGPLIALILLQAFPDNIRMVLYIAAIPSVFALLLFFFIKESKKHILTSKGPLKISFRDFPRHFIIFLLGMALFSLGNSSDTFLILRSKDLGLSLSLVILVYIFYNLVYTLLSTPAGYVSDKIGTRKIFLTGIVIYALVHLGFAFNTNLSAIWLLFGVYGIYIAFTDAVSKAFIGSFIPPEKSGTAYGLLQTVTSIFTLCASVIAGVLWSAFSPQVTFLFSSLCAILSLLFFFFSKPKNLTP